MEIGMGVRFDPMPGLRFCKIRDWRDSRKRGGRAELIY